MKRHSRAHPLARDDALRAWRQDRMTIRGVLRDDMQTRAKLVEKPGEQLELLMHVLLTQGSEVEVVWNAGRLTGDPALVLYVERCDQERTTVSLDGGRHFVPVSLGDADSIAALLRGVFESRSMTIDETSDAQVE